MKPAREDLTLLDAVHDNRRLASSVHDRLLDIAGSLAEVGLDRPAEKIWAIAQEIIESAKRVSDAYGDDLSAHVRNSEQMTATLLQAVLVGAIQSPKKATKS